MSSRKFWIIAALVAVAPFAFVFRSHVWPAVAVHAAVSGVPPMVPSTITFSEIVSVNAQPAQHAIRVVANKRDRSSCDTFFWEHGATHAGFANDTFDRQLWLNKSDGYFKVEVYKRDNPPYKITFPHVAEMARLRNRTAMNPQSDCRMTYAGKPALGKYEKYLGKQQFSLPGVGLIDAVMTTSESPGMGRTSWYAPSLGCVEVQRVATFPQTDGSLSVDAMYPVSASLQDPDEAWFSDNGAQELEPTEVMSRLARAAAVGSNRSEWQVADMQARALAGEAIKNKQAQYKQAWELFRAGKLRP